MNEKQLGKGERGQKAHAVKDSPRSTPTRLPLTNDLAQLSTAYISPLHAPANDKTGYSYTRLLDFSILKHMKRETHRTRL